MAVEETKMPLKKKKKIPRIRFNLYEKFIY